jgi:hypothetical protein
MYSSVYLTKKVMKKGHHNQIMYRISASAVIEAENQKIMKLISDKRVDGDFEMENIMSSSIFPSNINTGSESKQSISIIWSPFIELLF